MASRAAWAKDDWLFSFAMELLRSDRVWPMQLPRRARLAVPSLRAEWSPDLPLTLTASAA